MITITALSYIRAVEFLFASWVTIPPNKCAIVSQRIFLTDLFIFQNANECSAVVCIIMNVMLFLHMQTLPILLSVYD